MSRHDASDLAQRLRRQAEAVCRHYLSSGRREGRYWLVGDVRNTPGRSMYVRLKDSPKGPAGKWTDAATGEHGDLLDVIRDSCGLIDFKDVADEARTFLSMPQPEPAPAHPRQAPAPHGSPEAARRLFGMSQPITGTLVQSYLRERGITDLRGTGNLRFHPRCYYRPDEHSPTETWPAMIAAVTDLRDRITGAHRTWLDPRRRDKAPLDTPRRAMGDLLGNAVRFGTGGEVMAAGEGIETVLSVRQVLSDMPMLAALSAAHLAAILFPTIRPVTVRATVSSNGRTRPASRRSSCLRGWATSTRTSEGLDWKACGQRRGYKSLPRTSHASWQWRHSRKGMLVTATPSLGTRSDAPRCQGEPQPGLREGDRPANGPDRQRRRPTIFRRPVGPFHRETK